MAEKMAENNEKKEGKVVTESTEGLKRKEQVDDLKETMRKLREIGKIGMGVVAVIILICCLISKLNVWQAPRLMWGGLLTFFVIFVGIWYFSHSFKMVLAWEDGVVFRLGRVLRTHPKTKEEKKKEGKKKVWRPAWPISKKKKADGEEYWAIRFPIVKKPKKPRKGRWTFILWPIDKIEFVNMWERRVDLPVQKIIIVEKVESSGKEEEIALELDVDAIFYFKVSDAKKALTTVEDFDKAVLNLVLSILRKKCGEVGIIELIRDRESVMSKIATGIGKQIKNWGGELTIAEFKFIDMSEETEKIFLLLFKADKEKKAEILRSEGEAQAVKNVYTSIRENDEEFQITNLKTLQEMSKNPATLIVPAKGLDVLSAVAASAGKAFKKGSLSEGT